MYQEVANDVDKMDKDFAGYRAFDRLQGEKDENDAKNIWSGRSVS